MRTVRYTRSPASRRFGYGPSGPVRLSTAGLLAKIATSASVRAVWPDIRPFTTPGVRSPDGLPGAALIAVTPDPRADLLPPARQRPQSGRPRAGRLERGPVGGRQRRRGKLHFVNHPPLSPPTTPPAPRPPPP